MVYGGGGEIFFLTLILPLLVSRESVALPNSLRNENMHRISPLFDLTNCFQNPPVLLFMKFFTRCRKTAYSVIELCVKNLGPGHASVYLLIIGFLENWSQQQWRFRGLVREPSLKV